LDHITAHAIDLIEAAYDLEKSDSEWLCNLIDVGAPILDHGLGIFGFGFVRPPAGGGGADAVVGDMCRRAVPEDLPERLDAARSTLSPDFVRAVTPSGFAGTWTEVGKDYPEEIGPLLETMGYPDMLAISATDPNGIGVQLSAPLPEATKLSPRSRECWQMLGAHIASGYRLRHALTEIGGASGGEPTGLPLEAEAVLDAKGFRLVDSVGPAKQVNATNTLRRAARTVDRSRGRLRLDDPQRAFETWKALVCGRWSIVDWFDTARRRFVLAIPNSPEAGDPRGLTEQECQVVSYVLQGDTNKVIAYRLGLSQGRVSGLLKSVMHKQGVRSKAALVEKLGPLGVLTGTHGDESAA
jgi:DNA-binding CsgD family transcriptional regulator